MENNVQIDEGATYEYLRHGFALFIVGLILLAVHWIFTIPVLVAAVGLMAIKTGIDIDIANKKIRKHMNIMGYKKGEWIDLSNYIQIDLKFNSQVSKYDSRPTTLFMPGLGKHKVGTAKTYDLILTNDLGEKVLFNPFLKISLALKAVKALEKIDGIHVNNHVDNWMSRSFSRDRR